MSKTERIGPDNRDWEERFDLGVEPTIDQILSDVQRRLKVKALPAKIENRKGSPKSKIKMVERQSKSDSSSEARRKSLEGRTSSVGTSALRKDEEQIPSFEGYPAVEKQALIDEKAAEMGIAVEITRTGGTIKPKMATDALDKPTPKLKGKDVATAAGVLGGAAAVVAGGIAVANTLQNPPSEETPTPEVTQAPEGSFSTYSPEPTGPVIITQKPSEATQAPTEVATETAQPWVVDQAVNPEVQVPEGLGQTVFAEKLGPNGESLVVTFDDNVEVGIIPEVNVNGAILSNRNGVLDSTLNSIVDGGNFYNTCSEGTEGNLVFENGFGGQRGEVEVNPCKIVIHFTGRMDTTEGWLQRPTEDAWFRVRGLEGRIVVDIVQKNTVNNSGASIGPESQYFPYSTSLFYGSDLLDGLLLARQTVNNGGEYVNPRGMSISSNHDLGVSTGGLSADQDIRNLYDSKTHDPNNPDLDFTFKK